MYVCVRAYVGVCVVARVCAAGESLYHLRSAPMNEWDEGWDGTGWDGGEGWMMDPMQPVRYGAATEPSASASAGVGTE